MRIPARTVRQQPGPQPYARAGVLWSSQREA